MDDDALLLIDHLGGTLNAGPINCEGTGDQSTKDDDQQDNPGDAEPKSQNPP
jgi:hypothetical protein